jgi:hypothetical protein
LSTNKLSLALRSTRQSLDYSVAARQVPGIIK